MLTEGDVADMAQLKAKNRKRISKKNFAVPKGKGKNKSKNSYPIHDKNHARNALSRVSQYGTAKEKRMVRSKVRRKFPSIGKKKKSK